MTTRTGGINRCDYPAAQKKGTVLESASVNRAILRHCLFWFSNTGADAAIAILLPTLKHFSCNGAVGWSTTYFCCESALQKTVKFL